MDDMSGFVIDVADFMKKESRMTILHNHMNLYCLIIYAQYLEYSKLSRISRNLKRSGSIEKNQPRFNKKDPFQ